MFRVLTMVVMIVSLLASGAAVSAQGTPAAGGGLLGDLGYPEVTIVATESGYEIPSDIQAGIVLITLENRAPFPVGFSLIQLPEGASPADLMPPAGASPVAGEEAAPEEGFPPILYDAVWAGGVFAFPGGPPAQAVVTLTPGEWLLLGPPDVPVPPQPFTVGGEAGEAPATPEGAVSVELDNFQIILPEQIQAGPQIWEVTNIGDQPHEIFVSTTPERLSAEDALTLVQLPPDATPPPGLPSLEETMPVGFIAPISGEQTTLVEMNLEPGHYVAVCFLPEKESGEPHAFKGMVTTFSVGAEGEQVEPPASPVPDEHGGH
ncbi:MAG TPA: hypothetical protein VGW38_04795 [Chloroflexota bacterium]|nr:hypothetical protein [Chloroflexota bacterium]